MSLLATFMVPHPPLIIPEVGKGGEKEIEKTSLAYQEVAREIAKLNPETIIIISPHAPMYSDYFYISAKNQISGDLSQFGASTVKYTEEVDLDLVDEITELAEKYNFPTGKLVPPFPLDHGTIVPLYFIRKELPKNKLLVIGLSTLPLVDNYKMGQIIKEAINNLNKNVVIIASGDLSHKLKENGPYGYIKEGPEYDKRIMEVCSKGEFSELLKFDSLFLEKAAECGHRSFTIMAGALDGIDVEAKELSHEDITGVGYGICTFYPKVENKERFFLEKHLNEKELELNNKKELSDDYVKLARLSIENYILKKEKLTPPQNIPMELLENKAGVFVSIHKHDTLRGCIGTIVPTKENIAEEIISNAISAAIHDSRFQPITEDELKWLEINVDVLKKTEPIESKEELDVKKYGVIVTSGFKQGLLLPNLDGIETIDDQISIAMRKGNIQKTDNYKLQRFEVIRHY